MIESEKDQQAFSRRAFLRRVGSLTIGASAASVLAACGGAPEPAANAVDTAAPASEPRLTQAPAAAEAKKVQLYQLAWQPGAIAAIAKAVDDWNGANKDRVEVENIQGSWEKARDYLTTSIAGGVAPDIAQGVTAWSIDYGHQGGYLDLTTKVKGSPLGSDLDPKALSFATSPLENKIFGVPFVWEIGMLFVNADRFAEQDIALPEQGWTWDEFSAAARKLTKAPEYYGLAANLGATQTTEDIIAWMWQTGAEVMGEVNGKWQIDVEPARAALQLWHDMLWQDNVISQDSFAAQQGSIVESFALGTYSIIQAGCWARRITNEAKPSFTWRMLPLPSKARNASSAQPQTWSIAADSEKRGSGDAAWEVLEWMTNQQNSVAIAAGDWLFPTTKSAMADPMFASSDNDWNLALNELQYGKTYPNHPAWTEFDDRVMGPNIQKYLQNDIQLDELITTLTEDGNKIIAEKS